MADRPLECSECKKEAMVTYTEIVGSTITKTVMCSDCPALKRRLKGEELSETTTHTESTPGLCCGNCGTTMESVQTGHPLGCQQCYEVFADAILAELKARNKVFMGVKDSTSVTALHMGRGPGESGQISPSARLLALNEALNETLSKEEYEQAAWLRDQIKALTEEEDGGGEEGKE